MMGKMRQYDGYYGTTRCKADKIIQMSDIPMADVGEHGRGIYFVEGDVSYVLESLKMKMVKSNRAMSGGYRPVRQGYKAKHGRYYFPLYKKPNDINNIATGYVSGDNPDYKCDCN